MNDLSWFLYFADSAPRFGVAMQILGGIGFVVGAFWGAIRADSNLPAYIWKNVSLMVAAPILILLGTLIPSSNTMYAIAASELGEQVVTSDTGKKIASALEAWLDKQLEQVGK